MHNLYNDLLFLPERVKSKNVKKNVDNLHNKTKHVKHKGNLKQAFNNGSVLKEMHRINKFKQKALLK